MVGAKRTGGVLWAPKDWTETSRSQSSTGLSRNQSVYCPTSAVNKNVDGAELFKHLVGQRLHLISVANVRRHGDDFMPLFIQRFCDAGRLPFVEVGDNDPSPFCAQSFDD